MLWGNFFVVSQPFEPIKEWCSDCFPRANSSLCLAWSLAPGLHFQPKVRDVGHHPRKVVLVLHRQLRHLGNVSNVACFFPLLNEFTCSNSSLFFWLTPGSLAKSEPPPPEVRSKITREE